MRLLGLGDVYQIGIGRCLQWNIVMNDDIGRAGPEYSIIRIFVWWVGIRFSILRFEYPFIFIYFSQTPGIPHETVLNLSAWLNICTSNRPFANERRSCWPIACIYFMKNLLLWARLPHIYIWNNELKRAKDATCERTLCYHKTECDACVFFVNCPEMRAKVLGQRAVACSADEMRWYEAALREWKREDAVQLNHSHCFQMTDLIC